MPRRLDQVMMAEARVTHTPSDLLAEVHVYILPQEKWIPFRRLARNTVVEETVSAGFVRVLPDVTLVDLRREFKAQIGDDLPDTFVFIKSVGRNFTQVKPHQEQAMKVKSFLPPHATDPEVHILEVSEELVRHAPSLSNLLASDTEMSDSQVSSSRMSNREAFKRGGSQDDAVPHLWEEQDGGGVREGGDGDVGDREGGADGPGGRGAGDGEDESQLNGHERKQDGDEKASRKGRSRGRRSSEAFEKGSRTVDEKGEGESDIDDRQKRVGNKGFSNRRKSVYDSEAETADERGTERQKRATASRVNKRGSIDKGEENISNGKGDKRGAGVKGSEKSSDKGDERGNNSNDEEKGTIGTDDKTKTNGKPTKGTKDKDENDKQMDRTETKNRQNKRRSSNDKLDIKADERRREETLKEENEEEGRDEEREGVTSSNKDGTHSKSGEITGGRRSPAGGEGGVARRGRGRGKRRGDKQLTNALTESEADDEESVSPRHRLPLKSDKFVTSRKPIRSLSESSLTQSGELEANENEKPKMRRTKSFDPMDYAPHRWYYAREAKPPSGEEEEEEEGSETPVEEDPESRKARLLSLKAAEAARLASGEAGDEDNPRPHVEILSVDGELGSLRSRDAQGRIINGDHFGSLPDHLELSYDVEVGDETGEGNQIEISRRVKKIGRDAGEGRAAWESEIEDSNMASTEFGEDADGEETGDFTDDTILEHGGRRKKKSTKLPQKVLNENLTPEEQLTARLGEVLQEKSEMESLRQELFIQARETHEEILRVKEKRREKWWRQYHDAKKTGTQLEERQAGLRSELDALHRRIIGSIMKRQPLVTGVRDEPSRKANYKISIIRLRHEIEDLKRRVEAMDIKVEAEVKLRTQAEREVKTLRTEVSRKKANVALSQSRANNMLKNMTSLPPELTLRM